MAPVPLHVALILCEETGVLVATSDDIPGLVLEAATFGGIMDALLDCAPELIRQNRPDLAEDECRVSFESAQHPALRSCTVDMVLSA